jgi:hypothetical protein
VAVAQLATVDGLISKLKPAEDVGPALSALTELLEGACFAIARPDAPPMNPDSARSLKTFWEDGGRWWVAHYLSLGNDVSGQDRVGVVAPSVRKTLAADARWGASLGPLLCPADDASCGLETRGWALRAQLAFEQYAIAHRDPDNLPMTQERCDELSKRESHAYDAWRACIETIPLRTDALPLGALRAPSQGWLLLRGRRGHHSFCDEGRFYDLATGSSYVAKSCGELATRPDGSVDPIATGNSRRRATELGLLPVENLREAAWMIILAPEVQPDVRLSASGYSIPEHMRIVTSGDEPRMGEGSAKSHLSGDTILTWDYFLAGRSVSHGTLTWPVSGSSAAQAHAARLLHVAEAGLRTGCPPASIPAPVVKDVMGEAQLAGVPVNELGSIRCAR